MRLLHVYIIIIVENMRTISVLLKISLKIRKHREILQWSC